MKGWVITRDAADGTKRYDACWWIGSKKKSRTFQRRKDADGYLITMVKRVQDGSYVDVQPALMGEVFDRWLEHSLEVRRREGSLKPSTTKSYRSMLEEHLRPAFAAYRSDRFTLGVIEAWRAGIAQKIATGKMAPKFFVNLKNLLSTIIGWARHPERRYLAHDPLAGLERIRGLPRAKKRPHYEPAQVLELLKAATATPPDDTIIRVALYSGLRRGELFALKWDDVDPGTGQDGGGQLHVRRSIYQGAITSPKTEESDRVVDIPQRLLDDLVVYRVMYPVIGEGFVFRQETGRPLDPDTWHRERLVPILEQAKLRLPRAGLHALRHTYVSLLINQGEDPRYIADQVGHSTTRLTTDLYAHMFNRVRVQAMRRLDRWASLGSAEAIPSGAHPAEPADTARTGENTRTGNASETEG
jgi:integrase